jgi:hypothetical protein
MSMHLLCGTMWMKTFLVTTFKIFSRSARLLVPPHRTIQLRMRWNNISHWCMLYNYTNMDEIEQYFALVHAFPFSNCLMVVHSSFVYLFIYIDSMFDSRYLTSRCQPTMKQLDKLCREGINGGPHFLSWFREHVNPDHIYIYYSALLSLII